MQSWPKCPLSGGLSAPNRCRSVKEMPIADFAWARTWDPRRRRKATKSKTAIKASPPPMAPATGPTGKLDESAVLPDMEFAASIIEYLAAT